MKTQFNEKLINKIEHMQVGEEFTMFITGNDNAKNSILIACINFRNVRHIICSYDEGLNSDIWNIDEQYRADEILNGIVRYYDQWGCYDIDADCLNYSIIK